MMLDYRRLSGPSQLAEPGHWLDAERTRYEAVVYSTGWTRAGWQVAPEALAALAASSVGCPVLWGRHADDGPEDTVVGIVEAARVEQSSDGEWLIVQRHRLAADSESEDMRAAAMRVRASLDLGVRVRYSIGLQRLPETTLTCPDCGTDVLVESACEHVRAGAQPLYHHVAMAEVTGLIRPAALRTGVRGQYPTLTLGEKPMSLAQIVSEAVAAQGGERDSVLAALAEAIGGTVDDVQAILTGETACPTLATLAAFESALGVSGLQAQAEADGCSYEAPAEEPAPAEPAPVMGERRKPSVRIAGPSPVQLVDRLRGELAESRAESQRLRDRVAAIERDRLRDQSLRIVTEHMRRGALSLREGKTRDDIVRLRMQAPGVFDALMDLIPGNAALGDGQLISTGTEPAPRRDGPPRSGRELVEAVERVAAERGKTSLADKAAIWRELRQKAQL